MHKIHRPALVQRFRGGQWRGITHRQPLFALTAKIQFQQTINTVDPFVIPGCPCRLRTLKSFENRIVGIARPLPATRQ